MKFSKEEKGFVSWWIDRQFAKNPLFPASCIVEKKDKKSGVSKAHVKAYKAWGKTSNKRSQIQEWIDEWLTKDERKELKAALEKRTAGDVEQTSDVEPVPTETPTLTPAEDGTVSTAAVADGDTEVGGETVPSAGA